MVKETLKKNLSSINVLKTLKFLLDNDYTMADLIEKLNENEPEPYFNNSVISKYINTCRYCGIEIPKIQNKYYITKLPFGLNLNNNDVNLIQKLKDIIVYEMSSKSQQIFQSFVDKLNRYANKKITRVEKKHFSLALEAFEKALNNQRKVKLLFKNRYELTGAPITISTERGKVFFHIFCKDKTRMIDAERISGIQTLEETFLGHMREKKVLFRLKNKLAKRYDLRPEEKILNIEPDGSIVISNNSCNTEMLISRLLRYDNLCEIISPAELRKQMQTTIDDTLKNYGIE